MKVLLMSVRAGYGHHSTAKAIMEYFEDFGHECDMLDVFDNVNHILGNSINDGYLLSTKYLSGSYGRIYEKMTQKEEPYHKGSPVSVISSLISKKLTTYVENFAPDLVIATHSYAGVLLSILAKKGIVKCPTIGIVTDFTVHPFWESTFLDYYVIPDMLISYELEKKGIPKEKHLPIGIPVRKQFSTSIPKSEARKLLGFEDKKTILVMMGSMGHGDITKTMLELDDYPADFQIICVCGSNKKVENVLSKINWEKTVHIFGFVDNVDVMMDACDFIVSKPGGLTTSEAFAKGLPMITMNPMPGHEDRNTQFLVNSGSVLMVNEKFTITEAIHQLLSCQWRVESLKKSISYIGKPNATADLYKFVCEKLWAKSTDTEKSIPVM